MSGGLEHQQRRTPIVRSPAQNSAVVSIGSGIGFWPLIALGS
jgi:hypothetical protein